MKKKKRYSARALAVLLSLCAMTVPLSSAVSAEEAGETEVAVLVEEAPEESLVPKVSEMEGSTGVSAYADTMAEGIAIDEANFPDANFRQYVLDNFDANGDGALSEIEISTVTEINVNGCGIADLTGIEYFTALSGLYCNDNQLTKLDVSQNTGLQILHCAENQLERLDVSKNVALTIVHCYMNQLTELDMSQNTELTQLDCGKNQLAKLDISRNTILRWLTCYENQLTSLDVSQNTEIFLLDCSKNQLSELNVSENIALKSLNCADNHLTSLDLSQNGALSFVQASENSRNIVVDMNRQFDLAVLPNFDASRASNWVGGTVNGTVLTVDQDVDKVTYTYNCHNHTEVFTLVVAAMEEPTQTPTPTSAPEPTEKPAEDLSYMLKIEGEDGIRITEGLKAAGVETPEQVKEKLLACVLQNEGYTAENTDLFEVTLRVSKDDGYTWGDVSADSFPESGEVRVTLPYPKGAPKDTPKENYKVYHMFTQDINGHKAGEIEACPVEKIDEGLVVTLHGLSPVMVAWKPVDEAAEPTAVPSTEPTSAPSAEPTEQPKPTAAPSAEPTAAPTEQPAGDAPKTGDNGVHVLWIAAVLLSGGAMTALVWAKRKKQ